MTQKAPAIRPGLFHFLCEDSQGTHADRVQDGVEKAGKASVEVGAAEGIDRLGAFDAGHDDAGLTQNFEVMGKCRFRDRRRSAGAAGLLAALGQCRDNMQARRITQAI